ncbi:glycosyltransferase family 2 protein [Winogradskyella undariae]|uniref:glycosyltransferase family 2 protein n=1 Tax=Winogradskyella undariae TaxID=1285465 RepID=UPI00156B2513|nr:glycosyltransferase family 2 protein [Winogradskyella undariae]NRR92006.1 glycosyltransferase family 2 protein [Winogradskyella undariae]
MLAIIIPYYKHTFFKDTLQSLANQTDKRFTVYIGNDASPENPEALIKEFKGQLSIVYKSFSNNLGGKSLVQQWERCLALIQNEEWIQILGDDDLVSSNFVASFYNALPSITRYSSEVIRWSTYVVDENGDRTSEQFMHLKLETAVSFFERKFSKKTRSSLSEYVFKKTNVLEIGFQAFNLAWHADDMAVFEFSNNKSIYSINTAYVSVRVSKLNITGDSQHYVAKNKGTFQFMEHLFNNYSNVFSTGQKQILLKKLEMAYYNIPSYKRWIKVNKLYYNALGIYGTFDFLFRNFKTGVAKVLKRVHLFNTVKRLTAK